MVEEDQRHVDVLTLLCTESAVFAELDQLTRNQVLPYVGIVLLGEQPQRTLDARLVSIMRQLCILSRYMQRRLRVHFQVRWRIVPFAFA